MEDDVESQRAGAWMAACRDPFSPQPVVLEESPGKDKESTMTRTMRSRGLQRMYRGSEVRQKWLGCATWVVRLLELVALVLPSLTQRPIHIPVRYRRKRCGESPADCARLTRCTCHNHSSTNTYHTSTSFAAVLVTLIPRLCHPATRLVNPSADRATHPSMTEAMGHTAYSEF